MKKISLSTILCLLAIIAISQPNYVQGTLSQDATNANIVDIYGLTTGSYNYAIQELDFVISIPKTSSSGVTVALASNALTATYGGSWTTYSSVQDAQNTYYKFKYYNASATTPFSFSSNTAVQLATVSFKGGIGSAQIGLTDQLSTSSITYRTYKWYISVVGVSGNDGGSGGISSTNYNNPSLNNAIYYANAGKSTMGANTGNAQYVSTILAITLPITLINFTAVKIAGKVNLAWVTAFEANTASFLVQHSSNGVDFTSVASIVAVGAGANKYTAVDANPLSGISFYRLKNIDIDRYFTYSGIVSINFDKNNKNCDLSVYPSPAKSIINIVVSTPSLYGTVSNLVDLGGHILKSFTITGNTLQVDVSNFSTGMYFIKLANGNAVKFIKN